MERPGLKQGHWQTRALPNNFPALVAEGDASRPVEGIFLVMPGYGRDEVIIGSPRHNRDLAQMQVGEVGIVMETDHRRSQVTSVASDPTTADDASWVLRSDQALRINPSTLLCPK